MSEFTSRICKSLAAIGIAGLVVAALSAAAAAADWPAPPQRAELIGRWEFWHDNRGAMREYVQIERRGSGEYVAAHGYVFDGEEPGQFSYIQLDPRHSSMGTVVFQKVDDPHGESFSVTSSGLLSILDGQGAIPVFNTDGQVVTEVASLASSRRAKILPKDGAKTQDRIAPYQQALVRNYAIEAVRSRLTSPRSARFSSLRETLVQHAGEGVYLVTGHVDSQNRFGATVRTRWTAEIDCFRPNGGSCTVSRVAVVE